MTEKQDAELSREDFFATFGDQTGPRPSTFPTLHGKAAKIHHALKPLHMACQQMNNPREEHQHRLAAIESMVEFYDVLRQASHVLTDDEYDSCDQAATRFLLHRNALAMIYWMRKEKLHKVTFKSHLFWHLANFKQCRWTGTSLSLAATCPVRASHQFQTLMEMLLLEICSAREQEIAEGDFLDTQADGQTMHPAMQMLAACGYHGEYPGNVWRDLEKKMRLSENDFPQPLMMTNVPILDKTQHPPTTVYREWPIFLMQDLLHWSYHHNRSEFFRLVGSTDLSALRKYWMSFRADDPRLIDHPVTFIHEWQAIAIPAGVHGDGVPFGKSRINAEVANISSPLATGDTFGRDLNKSQLEQALIAAHAKQKFREPVQSDDRFWLGYQARNLMKMRSKCLWLKK